MKENPGISVFVVIGQEQQLFLQEVHLHCLHLQEPMQQQDLSEAQEQLGSMASGGSSRSMRDRF